MRKLLVGPVVIALAIAGSVCPGSSGAQQPRRPNIIFILVDDLRWDDLAVTGHPVEEMNREMQRLLKAQ